MDRGSVESPAAGGDGDGAASLRQTSPPCADPPTREASARGAALGSRRGEGAARAEEGAGGGRAPAAREYRTRASALINRIFNYFFFISALINRI